MTDEKQAGTAAPAKHTDSPADTEARSPWRVGALIAAGAVATVTMVIGLGSAGLEGGHEYTDQWLYCAGARAHERSPTVWIEPDVGESGLATEALYREVSKTHRVCTRDRRGLGRAAPRTAGTPTAEVLAKELQSLHSLAGEDGPFVFVGLGAGALTLRAYAADHPAAVLHTIEVDPPQGQIPFHPDRAEFLAGLPPDIRREFDALATTLESPPPAAPSTVAATADKLSKTPEALVTLIQQAAGQ